MKMIKLHRLKPASPFTWILGIGLCLLASVPVNRIYMRFFAEVTHPWLGVMRKGVFFGILFFAYLHFVFPLKKIYDFIYKYRFPLALLLFAGCVALKLHGSSIGVWNNYIRSAPSPSPYQYAIFGVPRPIRSDEWNVFTPLAMSQAYNDYGIVNEIACAWPTSMLTTYHQPAWDLTMIAKPFYWGYLLLGSEYGLSWFWCGRMIALFLVTFEMFMVITGKRKTYALAAAFLITFSAFVQWWFAINFLVEMLIWGQLAELMLLRFLNTESRKTKLLCTGVFALCGLGFLFSLYPAWMIPLLYVFFAIALWILLENYGCVRRRAKDLLYPLGAVLVIGAVAGYWLNVSAEAISATMNTVYPGDRICTGRLDWSCLSFYLNNLFLPYTTVRNSCEPAMAYGFFPFTEILVLIWLVKNRFRDKLLLILAVLDAFFLVFFLVGFPPLLAKITLLQWTSHRLAPIICTVEVIMFLRLLSGSDEPLLKNKKGKILLLGALCLLAAVFLWVSPRYMEPTFNPAEGMRIRYRLIMLAIIAVYCAYFFIRRTEGRKLVFMLAAAGLSLVTGLFVNPLMRTTDAIYDKPLAGAVRQIQAEDPGVWISSNCIYSNYLISNGVPAVNSVNIIPTMERWEKLDESGRYADVYNRYAHIHMEFAEETRFELGGLDWLTMYLNLEDLWELGVDYILMPAHHAFPSEEWNGVTTQIYTDGQLAVYKLEDNR